MVAFGRLFISNPDLVNRLRLNAPLAAVHIDTLYGGGAAGYTDYPTLDPALAARLESGGHPLTDFDFRYRA